MTAAMSQCDENRGHSDQRYCGDGESGYEVLQRENRVHLAEQKGGKVMLFRDPRKLEMTVVSKDRLNARKPSPMIPGPDRGSVTYCRTRRGGA